MQVLVVNGFAAGDSVPVVDRLETVLSEHGHQVERCDLAVDGFDAFMSAEERAVYHSDEPLLTDEAAAAAAAVQRADALLLAYPVTHRTCPPRVKSWQERVFVLGVGFEFKPSGKITGALDHLKRACVIGVSASGGSKRELGGGRNDLGPCLARSFYLSSNRTCRSRYVSVLGDDTAAAELIISRW